MKRTSICLIGVAMAALVAAPGMAKAQTIGTADADITGARSRSQETTAGNLVADALKASTRADAAMVPADAFTSGTVSKGPVSRADLKGLLEDADDEVAVITISGTKLTAALERSVSAHPKPFDGFLQLSGIRVEFDSGRAPGPRLLKVTVNGAPLEPNREYRVATTKTLAGGALGYYRMWENSDVSNTGLSVIDMLSAYVKEQKTVAPRVDGRIAPR